MFVELSKFRSCLDKDKNILLSPAKMKTQKYKTIEIRDGQRIAGNTHNYSTPLCKNSFVIESILYEDRYTEIKTNDLPFQ